MIVLLIFCILFLLTYGAIQIRNRYNRTISETCNSDTDCPKGTTCRPNPEYKNKKQCFDENKKYCDISPATSMTKCVLGTNDCNVCLNNPKFSCVEVTESSPYVWKVKDNCTVGGLCTNYEGTCIAEKNETFCEITAPPTDPGFGWCLPKIEDTDVVCNPYTSNYVLQEVDSSTSTYKWACRCKYPNLFGHSSDSGSNCTLVKACGQNSEGEGTLYLPRVGTNGNYTTCTSDTDCNSVNSTDLCMTKTNSVNEPCISRLLDPDVSIARTKVCHTKWDPNSDRNPLEGRCKCRGENMYQCVKIGGDLYQMSCVESNNTCKPYTESVTTCKPGNAYISSATDSAKCCICGPGSIRCPDDIPETSGLNRYCKDNGPICVRDPCSSTDIPDGTWNPVTGQCKCDKTNPHGREVADETNPIGRTCKDLCKGTINPCSDRGTCFVKEGSNRAQCCGCKDSNTNTSDQTCSCSNTQTYYPKNTIINLDYNSTRKILECDGHTSKDNPKNYQYWEGSTKVGNCVKFIGDGCPPALAREKGLWEGEENVCSITDTQDLVRCATAKYCPAGTTCDMTNPNEHKCCPGILSKACGNGKCCPKDYPVCDIANNLCKNTDNNTSIPMALTPGNPATPSA